MDNKAFIARLAKNTGRDQKSINALVSALASVIGSVAADNDSLAIPGFGSFVPVKENEHIVTDPSGTRTMYPPEITLAFVPGTMLKKRVLPAQ